MPVSTIKNPQFYLKPLENPPEWTEEEKKIIAWSIDWEGTIGITKSQPKHKSKILLRPYIAIGNTNIKLLKRFFSIIKLGAFYKAPRKMPRKTMWFWMITNTNECYYVLESIQKYLCAKKKQAFYSIKFFESRLQRNVQTEPSLSYSKKELRLYRLIRDLNKRGCE